MWAELIKYMCQDGDIQIALKICSPSSERSLHFKFFNKLELKEMENYISSKKEYIAAIEPAFKTSLEHTIYRG